LEIFEQVFKQREEIAKMHSFTSDVKKKTEFITSTIKANPGYLKNLRELIIQADAKKELVILDEPVSTPLSERYPPFIETSMAPPDEPAGGDSDNESDDSESDDIADMDDLDNDE
jgi:hypothetical protein